MGRRGRGLGGLRFPFPPAAEVKLISITSVAEKEKDGRECQDGQEAWGAGGVSPFIFPQGL